MTSLEFRRDLWNRVHVLSNGIVFAILHLTIFTISACDTRTIDGLTHDDSIYPANISSLSKMAKLCNYCCHLLYTKMLNCRSLWTFLRSEKDVNIDDEGLQLRDLLGVKARQHFYCQWFNSWFCYSYWMSIINVNWINCFYKWIGKYVR